MKRCLIVDDNRALAENLGEILEESGNTAVLARDLKQAMACVRRERFDVLITDLRLPGLSGARLLAELRRIDPGLPALALTAYSSDANLALAHAEGVLALLPKPVPVERLLTLVSVAKRDALVLLVTDDVALPSRIAELLREEGYTVVSVPLDGLLKGLELRPFLALVSFVATANELAAARQLTDEQPGLPRILFVDEVGQDLAGIPHLSRNPLETPRLLAAVGRCYRDEPHAV